LGVDGDPRGGGFRADHLGGATMIADLFDYAAELARSQVALNTINAGLDHLQLKLFEAECARLDLLADNLVAALDDGVWHSRAELKSAGWQERHVRLARQHSGGRVIFGQAGYRLAAAANVDEINACINTLESQAKVMFNEAQAVRKAAHGRLT